MTPAFSISVGGTDVTGAISDRLINLEIILNDGHENDRINITIDDRDFKVAIPPDNSKLSVSLGYRETGLGFMGTYSIDNVEVVGPPYKVGITGTAADQKSTQKQHRTTVYEKKTVSAIISEMAGRNGLSSYVSPELGSFTYPYLHQSEESDWHLGTRLGFDHDALFSIKNGTMFFVGRGDSTSAGGKAMPQITLGLRDLLTYHASRHGRAGHKQSTSSWHDRTKGRVSRENSDNGGTGNAVFGVRHLRPNRSLAKLKAGAKAKDLKRKESSVEVEVEGNPSFQSEGMLVLQTGRSLLDGSWLIKTVRHAYSASDGYRCTISGEQKAS